ncbi:MAG: hypothetical protein ACF8R9_13375 [Phycisphaerales bacterium JB054]
MARRAQRFRHNQVDAIGAACALFILFGAFWVGVRPMLHSWDDVKRLTGQVVGSREQLQNVQAEHRALQRSIGVAESGLRSLALELDSSDQLASRQEGIGSVLRAAGVTVEQLTVGAVQPGELLDVVPLRISGSGPSPKVAAAMHQLRERFPDLAVTSFRINASGKADSQQVTFGFDLAWYIASDGAPTG